MNWVWFYRLGSPLWFYQTTTRWLPWLSLLAFILLATGLVWGLGFAPQDAKQGNSFRIIYMHVPASFLALAGYFLMAAAGAIGLIWKMKLSYMVMKAAAPIGAALTFWRSLRVLFGVSPPGEVTGYGMLESPPC